MLKGPLTLPKNNSLICHFYFMESSPCKRGLNYSTNSYVGVNARARVRASYLQFGGQTDLTVIRTYVVIYVYVVQCLVAKSKPDQVLRSLFIDGCTPLLMHAMDILLLYIKCIRY